MGMKQVRAARKGSSLPEQMKGGPRAGTMGGAKDVSDKDFGAPKKNGAWETFPITKPPIGNESPHRGEHPKLTNKGGDE